VKQTFFSQSLEVLIRQSDNYLVGRCMAKKNVKAEKMKRIAELREHLEKRIEETKNEIESLEALLELVDMVLLEKGFKRPELPEPPVPKLETAPPGVEYKTVVPLKTVTGVLLANLHVGEDSLRVVMAEDKDFHVSTPPFMQFLIERVLAKMQEKDREAARAGKITPDKILSYNVVRDGDVIRELIVRNVSKERVRELKSSIRWTLEKMYEKMAESS